MAVWLCESPWRHHTHPCVLCHVWCCCHQITREFYAQGDLERSLGLEVSPLCDRHNHNLNKSQAGFINFIVRPAYTRYCEYLGTSKYLDILEHNFKQWTENVVESKPDDFAAPTNPNTHGSVQLVHRPTASPMPARHLSGRRLSMPTLQSNPSDTLLTRFVGVSSRHVSEVPTDPHRVQLQHPAQPHHGMPPQHGTGAVGARNRYPTFNTGSSHGGFTQLPSMNSSGSVHTHASLETDGGRRSAPRFTMPIDPDTLDSQTLTVVPNQFLASPPVADSARGHLLGGSLLPTAEGSEAGVSAEAAIASHQRGGGHGHGASAVDVPAVGSHGGLKLGVRPVDSMGSIDTVGIMDSLAGADDPSDDEQPNAL